MKQLVYAILCMFVVIYVYQYYRYPPSTGIVQTTVEGFSWDMLFSKQPIMINTPVPDPSGVLQAWFGKYTAVTENLADWVRNKYKYRILYNPTEASQEILVSAPHKRPDPEDGSVLAVKLPSQQLMILPFHWYLMSPEESPMIHQYGYHDWVTWVLP